MIAVHIDDMITYHIYKKRTAYKVEYVKVLIDVYARKRRVELMYI